MPNDASLLLQTPSQLFANFNNDTSHHPSLSQSPHQPQFFHFSPSAAAGLPNSLATQTTSKFHQLPAPPPCTRATIANKNGDDDPTPSAMVNFFREHSARLSSPIFRHRMSSVSPSSNEQQHQHMYVATNLFPSSFEPAIARSSGSLNKSALLPPPNDTKKTTHSGKRGRVFELSITPDIRHRGLTNRVSYVGGSLASLKPRALNPVRSVVAEKAGVTLSKTMSVDEPQSAEKMNKQTDIWRQVARDLNDDLHYPHPARELLSNHDLRARKVRHGEHLHESAGPHGPRAKLNEERPDLGR